MEKPLSLTLRYSAHIAGDLALLPRLYTFLQRLGAADGGGALLLDLGGTCSEAVWHCRASGGRSTLIVLDGMGYHAANVEGALDADNRAKLAGQVTMALVDARHDWTYHVPPARDPGIVVALRPRLLNGAARLQIALAPAAETRIDGNALHLRAVDPGCIGEAVVDLRGGPRLASARVHTMPSDTPPNASIAGAVEFVEAEARYYQRQHGKQTRKMLTTEENEATQRTQRVMYCFDTVEIWDAIQQMNCFASSQSHNCITRCPLSFLGVLCGKYLRDIVAISEAQ